jgi:hypothetical protein
MIDNLTTVTTQRCDGCAAKAPHNVFQPAILETVSWFSKYEVEKTETFRQIVTICECTWKVVGSLKFLSSFQCLELSWGCGVNQYLDSSNA